MSFSILSMGALDEGHFCVELENGMKLDVSDLGLEKEPETIVIEDAVKVLLQGLGEDVNREGLKKTPRRVAKALREGTRGAFFFLIVVIYDSNYYHFSKICMFLYSL